MKLLEEADPQTITINNIDYVANVSEVKTGRGGATDGGWDYTYDVINIVNCNKSSRSS